MSYTYTGNTCLQNATYKVLYTAKPVNKGHTRGKTAHGLYR